MPCSRCGRPRESCGCIESQRRHLQRQAASSRQTRENVVGITRQATQDLQGSPSSRQVSGLADTHRTALSQPSPSRAHPAGPARRQASSSSFSDGTAPSQPPPIHSARRQTSRTSTHGAAPSHSPPARALPIRSVAQQTSGLAIAHTSTPSHPPANDLSPAASPAQRNPQAVLTGPAGQSAVQLAAAYNIDVLTFAFDQELNILTRRAEQSADTMRRFLERLTNDHNKLVGPQYPQMVFDGAGPRGALQWQVLSDNDDDDEDTLVPTNSVTRKSFSFRQSLQLW